MSESESENMIENARNKGKQSINSYCERYHWDRRLTTTGNLKQHNEPPQLLQPFKILDDPFLRPPVCLLILSQCGIINIKSIQSHTETGLVNTFY